MMLFGHLGIGLRLVQRFSSRGKSGLPLAALLLGTLLPDIIDKTVYYAYSWSTGLKGAELGLLSGTRTFGHTALFLVTLALLAKFTRSQWLAALSLGVATHLLLDHVGDAIGYTIWPVEGMPSRNGYFSANTVGLLWPFLGNEFPASPHSSGLQHLSTISRPHIWIGEVAGIFFLLRDQRIRARLWKRAYSPSRTKSSS